jgi:hypothetical protein
MRSRWSGHRSRPTTPPTIRVPATSDNPTVKCGTSLSASGFKSPMLLSGHHPREAMNGSGRIVPPKPSMTSRSCPVG